MKILKLFEVLRLYVRTVCVFFHVTARLSACSRVSRVSVRLYFVLTHFILETPKGVLAKSADPDQMPHNVASDLGLHYFASCSTIFQQKYLNLHSQTPLKLKMESSNTYGRRVHSV